LDENKSAFIQNEKNLKEKHAEEVERLNNIIKELKKAKPELVEDKPIHIHPDWMYKMGWVKGGETK